MRVIKPQLLSLLTRPYEFRRQCHLGISVLAFVPMDGSKTLLPEAELWPFVASHLPADTVLDEAVPKRGGEVLVIGNAWPRPEIDASKCRVEVKLGEIVKTLYVFGDRYFDGDRISEPQPFESMVLDWTTSFGGPGFEPNPLGRGIEPLVDAGGKKRFILPNVEHPDRLLRLRDQRPQPAGMGPIDRLWPQRMQWAGTYDQAWLKQQFPGFASDIDWRYFNVGDADQHQPRSFRGDESYQLLNLHPQRGRLTGQLPGIMARCLIRQGDAPQPFESVCELTTVWFFPEQERAVLVFQTSITVSEPDATDVNEILIAAEDLWAPRELAHYLGVSELRQDRERAAYEALNDQVLLPSSVDSSAGASVGDYMDGPGQIRRAHMMARLDREQEKLKDELAGQNLTSDPLSEGFESSQNELEKIKSLKLAELPEFIEEKSRTLSQARERLEKQQQESEARFKDEFGTELQAAAKPPDFSAADREREIRAGLKEMSLLGVDTRELEDSLLSAEALESYRFAEKGQNKLYRQSAHLQAPPAAKGSEGDKDRLLDMIKSGQSLAAKDFTGLDLRGIDLSNQDLAGIFLTGSDLREADLRGANLDEAVLAHCDLRLARLHGASLRASSLGKARLDKADLSETNLDQATLTGASLLEATLDGATLNEADIREATLTRTSLRHVQAPQLVFLKTILEEVDFSSAILDQAVFIEIDLSGCDFSSASLEKAVLLSCTGRSTVFQQAQLRNLRVVGVGDFSESDFSGADFSHANLAESNLRGLNLAGANMTGAILEQADLSGIKGQGASLARTLASDCRLSGADLREADLAQINLMQGSLERADLRGADFSGANLYRLQIGRAHISRQTRFDDAYTARVNIYPLKFPPKTTPS